jgi:hypothetical protein
MRLASVPHKYLRHYLLEVPEILLLISVQTFPELVDVLKAAAQYLQTFLVTNETRRRLQKNVDATGRMAVDLHHIEAVWIPRKRRRSPHLLSPHSGDFLDFLVDGQCRPPRRLAARFAILFQQLVDVIMQVHGVRHPANFAQRRENGQMHLCRHTAPQAAVDHP